MPRTCFCRCELCTLDLSKYSFISFLFTETPKSIQIMAILNHFTTTCWKNFQGHRLNKQLFFILRASHKSAAREDLEISAAGEEVMSERLITPGNVIEKPRIKTLKEMPGPSTLSNLIEFFWRDGFARIHEIQVMRFFVLRPTSLV